MLRGYAQVAHRTDRPAGGSGVDVVDEQVAALVEQAQCLEDTLVELRVVGVGSHRLAREVLGVRELVGVHATVGVVGHPLRRVAQGGACRGHAVGERVDHLVGRVVLDEHAAAALEPLVELVLGGVRGKQHELVAADTVERLVLLRVELEVETHLQDIAVARIVAVGIVHVLEVVDVDERHRDGMSRLPQLVERAQVAAAVAESREGVGEGGLDEPVLLVAQLLDHVLERGGVVVAAASHVHVLALHELLGVTERAGEVRADGLKGGEERVVVVVALVGHGGEVTLRELLGELSTALDAFAQKEDARAEFAHVVGQGVHVERGGVGGVEEVVDVGEQRGDTGFGIHGQTAFGVRGRLGRRSAAFHPRVLVARAA